MKSEAGETLGLAVAALDTTEQRELLEQFHHAQKLEAVGRLAAGIAHDFNNLLTVIRSYCDLALLEMADGAAGRDEIVQIRLAAERAAALSRQMLAMSRKQAIIPRPLAVSELVTEIEPMLLRVTGETVSFDIRCQLSVGLVHIDPTHLEQVLMNLVINAVDAMPNGGRLVIDVQDTVLDAEAVKRFVGLKPGGYVSLAVRDSGTGIDDETLRRIFDPFFTTKPQGKGTGLGLSTVYGIVRAAGGHVHVLSDVGAGTTFTVYLPVGAPRDGEPAHTTSRTAPAGPVAGGHEVVLVVEDDDLLRTSLARALRRRGFQVLEAAHGGEALRVALDHRRCDRSRAQRRPHAGHGRPRSRRAVAGRPATAQGAVHEWFVRGERERGGRTAVPRCVHREAVFDRRSCQAGARGVGRVASDLGTGNPISDHAGSIRIHRGVSKPSV